MPLGNGQILNQRYRITQLLAVGGFGAVYRAWDSHLNRDCAVKENLENTPEGQAQFIRESGLLANLSHPSLPRVIDYFMVPGQGQYLVMDFVEGEDLETIRTASGGALPENQVLSWMRQACEALTYLHNQQPPIIHRDIKPANIRITPQGRAVLVDFGIAREVAGGKTTRGARAVTPGYSPPEQYTGAGTDQRSDIYSLGATFYTLLTGVELTESIQRMMGPTRTTPPHLLRAGISSGTSLAIMRAIQPDRSRRFSTIEDFLAGLDHSENGRPLIDRLAWFVGLAILILLLGFVGTRFVKPTPILTATPTIAVKRSSVQIQETAPPTARPTLKSTETRSPDPSPTVGIILPTNTRTIEPAVRVTDSGAKVVRIPAGPFLQGSNVELAQNECLELYPGGACAAQDYLDETPIHSVYLKTFWIHQTEVTNAMYARCVAAGKCQPPKRIRSNTVSDYFQNQQYAEYPVIYVAWQDAANYCAWQGGRLPTEAEWEKAARGEDGRLYPWGNEFQGGRANFCDSACPFEWANKNFSDGFADTAPVGQYPDGASVYDVLDLAGNVWEWTADWYAERYYDSAPGDNPPGPSKGTDRVIRGGAWNCVGSILRGGTRMGEKPGEGFYNVGFRCVYDD